MRTSRRRNLHSALSSTLPVSPGAMRIDLFRNSPDGVRADIQTSPLPKRRTLHEKRPHSFVSTAGGSPGSPTSGPCVLTQRTTTPAMGEPAGPTTRPSMTASGDFKRSVHAAEGTKEFHDIHAASAPPRSHTGMARRHGNRRRKIIPTASGRWPNKTGSLARETARLLRSSVLVARRVRRACRPEPCHAETSRTDRRRRIPLCLPDQSANCHVRS